MQKFSGIEMFVKVSETLSFSEAGKRLGVSSSAVGKSISRLEERLGVRLFHRNTRTVRLTSKGDDYLRYCKRALAALDEGDRLLAEGQDVPSGTLKIGMPLVCSPFQSSLTQFIQQYPEIKIELDFSDRMVDVVDEGFDLVVRTGRLNDSRLMSKFLGDCEMRLVASTTYLDKKGRPSTFEDLAELDSLRFRASTMGRMLRWPVPEKVEATLSTRLTCSHVEMLYFAACKGTGVACLPDFLVSGAISDGTLEVVLPDAALSRTDFHLIWPSNHWRPKKLSVAIDFLGRHLLSPKTYG
ncbi:LysR substrate-binding domain-containing protein [Maritalea sp.]|uniref:LysR substrate-binding domain-containing protein n=1 Tax=Maritalea sp. TaxID=2003361 RepID=UPI003EF2E7C1